MLRATVDGGTLQTHEERGSKMGFFDEIVEAYRRKVGPAKVEYMAAHKRYEAVRDEAAAELVKTLRGAPELAALADFEALSGPNAIYVRWASPGDRAEMCLFFSDPTEATVYFAGEDYGRQFTFDAPLEDAVNLFLAWVSGNREVVTSHPECPHDWAETIGATT